MYKLVIIRHGQTTYNRDKIFCGWSDADLTEKGIEEAKSAGRNLKNAGYTFDIAMCSLLQRAQDTLSLALNEMGINNLETDYNWRLNERHYGALQGHRHADIAEKHSKEQVQIWRRSYNIKPPQLTEDDDRHPLNNKRYKHLPKEVLPSGESLEDTINRVLPYFDNTIVPQIKNGKKVIVSASGNSIRALVKHMDGITNDDIVGLEILNGTPLVYELDKDMNPIKKYYLLDNGVVQNL